ncbi:MAG: PEP/pyruvate-binding domain-containing protein [Candidatus Dojkabacteria bacterium]|nr:PEP/pyruvate-binding domain-containing protein [Candidatus Dojkabacteria bacterium]MDQ7020859.1 PEP/pyruvate-binding domain-containing protein [Candidatus Dojkabacteria bacterium]
MIQEYIDADFSGVTFTRNPNGGREMIIESVNGSNEILVSGKIKPEVLKVYRNTYGLLNLDPIFKELIDTCYKIDDLYRHPQDMEWVVKNNELYLVQTRAITTLSEDNFNSFYFLDDNLPKDYDFYFERTEISEVIPKAYPFMISFLEYLYKDDGPISSTYKGFGIRYKSTNFIKIIGNQIYVDKSKELKGILPASNYDYHTLSIRNFSSLNLKNIGLSIFNSIKLTFIKVSKNSLKSIERDLINDLNLEFSAIVDLEGFLRIFLEKYELVFRVNFLARREMSSLQKIIQRDEISLVEILSSTVARSFKSHKAEYEELNLLGNSINITDESAFIYNVKSDDSKNEIVNKWLNGVSKAKRKVLLNRIEKAQYLNYIRELTRVLTVKYITKLRELIKEEFKKSEIEADLYKFVSLDDLISGSLNRKELEAEEIEFIFTYKSSLLIKKYV